MKEEERLAEIEAENARLLGQMSKIMLAPDNLSRLKKPPVCSFRSNRPVSLPPPSFQPTNEHSQTEQLALSLFSALNAAGLRWGRLHLSSAFALWFQGPDIAAPAPENLRILKNLENAPSYYNHRLWESDRKETEHILTYIGLYPYQVPTCLRTRLSCCPRLGTDGARRMLPGWARRAKERVKPARTGGNGRRLASKCRSRLAKKRPFTARAH
eukprot:1482161-Rhodomonas_salina.2